jgi:hypothetical protein
LALAALHNQVTATEILVPLHPHLALLQAAVVEAVVSLLEVALLVHLAVVVPARLTLEQLLAALELVVKGLLVALVKTAHPTQTHSAAAAAVEQAQSASMRVLLVAMVALVQLIPSLAHP